MANTYRNVLNAKGLSEFWDGKDCSTIIPVRPEEYCQYADDYDRTGEWGWKRHNWGCDGRIFFSDVKNDTIFLLTANATPMRVVSKLSELIKDDVLEHEYSDQDQYNFVIYNLKWKNGKIIEAKISVYNNETEEYDTRNIDKNDILYSK